MFANLVITIEKRNCLLSNERNSLKCEFNCERLLVNGLDKARSQFSMHGDCRRNNRIRDFRIP